MLIRSILKNRARLAEEGVGVPGPARYRDLLREVSTTLRGEAADAETEAKVIDAIREDRTAERIVLSNENFLCRPDRALTADGLYPKASKSAWLRHCVPSHEVEFALGLRNPATFVPELARRAGLTAAPEGLSLATLHWSDVIADIAAANPGTRIIAWCHEDTPFVWSEIMRETTGHDPFTRLDGEFDMLETIISAEGMGRLVDFLDARRVASETKRRRAIGAFLEAHAIAEAIVDEIALEGWTDETVRVLSDLYEEDVARIRRMPGVTFIDP